MFTALFRGFAQLSDPRCRRIIWIGIAVALLVQVLLTAGLYWLLSSTAFFQIGWLDLTTDILGVLAVFVLSLFLFPSVVTAVAGLLLDDVARAAENRHYPDLPPVRDQSLAEGIGAGLRLAALGIALNLLVLPLYFIPVVNVMVLYGLNGYLLGREYFEVVALRRLDPGQARSLRLAHRGYLWICGAIITFLLTLPLVNLVAPVVATAFMLHIFEALRRRERLV
ncbi:EI24 domain-containing protein [Telmatospirillum sp. J64-1]|uniref:EI24 domain-containing protein n=1 Tax=Telmatospirillum sp. J64-1 TaxID=2502183 RepID=UPI00115D77C9|nr:EI24 domain-containing protein [Telmatospirillum sp. J64-1]